MTEPYVSLMTWLGIVFCISQSAMFSGMNLALFSVGRLRLEIEASTGNIQAAKLLKIRGDSNFILTTVLWGNVGINVLLTLLSNSVLAGVSAFLFSTILITFAGEILPQAYFSRNALKMVALLSPLLRVYQYALYPVTKSSAKFLDWWLGPESIQYFREYTIRELIKMHMEADGADIDRIEGLGALNFLAIDDLLVTQEGEPLDLKSLVVLPSEQGKLVFPEFKQESTDAFLRQIDRSGKKWVVLVNEQRFPQLVLDADSFLRHAFFMASPPDPLCYCHRPIVIHDAAAELGTILNQFKVHSKNPDDNVIEQDIVLVWGASKRIITGADILGRLMQGISIKHSVTSMEGTH